MMWGTAHPVAPVLPAMHRNLRYDRSGSQGRFDNALGSAGLPSEAASRANEK